MSEATVDTIAEANAEMYDRLLVSIEAGIGLLQIFIAVCDADHQREQIIAEYERELAPKIGHYRVELDRKEPSLRHAIASIASKENAVVTILGAEILGLSGAEDRSLDKFFGYLQWTREALREFQLPIVLWIPSRIFRELAKRSPDFWSWRNGVFQFESKPNLGMTKFLDFSIDDVTKDEQPKLVFLVKQLVESLAKAIATGGGNSHNIRMLYDYLRNLYFEQDLSQRLEFILNKHRLDHEIDFQNNLQNEAFIVLINNIATIYKSTGNYAESEIFYMRSLAISEKYLGANHPTTATSLNNLAELYRLMGKYQEAEPLYVRSFAIREEELGRNHPDTLTSLDDLAESYRLMGKYQKAEPLYVRSFVLRSKESGTNHPDTITSLNNLASLYESMGRYKESEPLFVRAVAISEDTLGSNHPKTQIIRKNLQILHQQLVSSQP